MGKPGLIEKEGKGRRGLIQEHLKKKKKINNK